VPISTSRQVDATVSPARDRNTASSAGRCGRGWSGAGAIAASVTVATAACTSATGSRLSARDRMTGAAATPQRRSRRITGRSVVTDVSDSAMARKDRQIATIAIDVPRCGLGTAPPASPRGLMLAAIAATAAGASTASE
jgi:hypothetical protein